jgi:6-phosphogluconolactonase
MKKKNLLKASITAVIALAIVSCSKNAEKNLNQASQQQASTEEMMKEKGANPDEVSVAGNTNSIGQDVNSATGRDDNAHYVYTETNSAAGNQVLVYKVKTDGTLSLQSTTTSGGLGTGKGLGSQGSLALDKNHEWLYAVNAGSNSVSSFKVHENGNLTLAYTESTEGTTPVSLSTHDNLLYVLNRGSDNIHGLRIGQGGALSQIEGSTKSLSSTAVDAPQISFTPNGDRIVVTEKATNTISTFRVRNNGSIENGVFTPSKGVTPFGFDFSRDKFLIVSNASGGVAGASTSTSYFIGFNGKPKDINGAVPNFQGSTCWLATTKYGRFAFTSNTGSNNISSYYIAPWGGLYLVDGEAAKSDLAPGDIAVTGNNYNVYALTAKSNTISQYHRKLLGGLEYIGSKTGIPPSAAGLATF